ncbi:MAG: SPFH domain-containing protein [Chloroflexota bacterium]
MPSLSPSALPTDAFTFGNLLSLLSWFVWGVFVVYVVTIFVVALRRNGIVVALIRLLSVQVILPLLIPIGFTLFTKALLFIPPQEVSVIVSLLSPGGVRPQPLRSGLHWIIPIFEWNQNYPIYWQTYTMSGPSDNDQADTEMLEGEEPPDDSILARTSDGQEVHLDTSVIFRIDEQQVVSLHVEWQNRYIVDLVRPLIRGVVRSQVSQFTAREVNSSARRDLETTLDRQLRDQLGEKGLIVDQFLLRNITFSPEFVAAIESKQVAVEQREQATYEAERLRILAQGEADAAIIRATGRSESFKLIGEALAQNEELVTYHYVEKLAPNVRVMLVPSESPFILPLPSLDTLESMTETVSAGSDIEPLTEPETTASELPALELELPTETISSTVPLSDAVPISDTAPISGTLE